MFRYLSLFFVVALGFGGGMYSLASKALDSFDSTNLLIACALSGIVFAVIVVAIAVLTAKGRNIGSAATRSTLLPISPPDALALLHANAPRMFVRVWARSQRFAPDAMTAITRPSWSSFGERVSIAVRPASVSGTVVEVNSRSLVPTTKVDFGVNQANVDTIIEAIDRLGASRNRRTKKARPQ